MSTPFQDYLPASLVAAASARVPDSFWWIFVSLLGLLSVASATGAALSLTAPGQWSRTSTHAYGLGG